MKNIFKGIMVVLFAVLAALPLLSFPASAYHYNSYNNYDYTYGGYRPYWQQYAYPPVYNTGYYRYTYSYGWSGWGYQRAAYSYHTPYRVGYPGWTQYPVWRTYPVYTPYGPYY